MIAQGDICATHVHSEVLTIFEVYEQALVAGDSATLDAMFWDSDETIRFGVNDRQRGIAELCRWRSAQGPLPGRQLRDTRVAAFGSDIAVVTTVFSYPGRPLEGRQTQIWIRLSEGWRIVSAHVSEVATLPRDSDG